MFNVYGINTHTPFYYFYRFYYFSIMKPSIFFLLIYRFLSSGITFVSLQFEFFLGRSTISSIIKETYEIVWVILQPEDMPEPTPDKWLDIAHQFYKKLIFPTASVPLMKNTFDAKVQRTQELYFSTIKNSSQFC